MDYEVEAVPADGWEFSHWQVVGRASNNPNDVYNNTLYLTLPIVIDLMLQWNQGIESPLVYLVAHFKRVDEPEAVEPGPVVESSPTVFENQTPVDEPEPVEPVAVTKEQALAAIETLRKFIEGE